MKLTVRLGKSNKKIVELLNKRHMLTGPENWGGIEGAELFYGQSYSQPPAWQDFLESGRDSSLGGLTLNNEGAAALLFIPVKGNRYLIYVFGYGFQAINTGFTEWDFGLKVVMNSIEPNGLKSVDSHSLDHRAKNRRVQLGTQGAAGEFDFDILQDLVSHISGQSTDKDFAKTLSGGESLSITVDLGGSSLLKKCKEIMDRYILKTYKNNFQWIDFIAPIKDEVIISQLNSLVVAEINAYMSVGTPNLIVLSYPRIIDLDRLDHLRFSGYHSQNEFELVDFESFSHDYCSYHPALKHNLEDIRLNLYDGHGKSFDSFTLHKMLTTEVELSGRFYILSHGQWYALDKTHYEKVSKFFSKFITSKEYFKTGTTLESSEKGYLTTIPSPDLEVLDTKLFYATDGAINSIEYCDIVTDKAEIIHVKDGGSSSKLSHMFNQGLVSTRLLTIDKIYRTSFSSLIKNKKVKASLGFPKLDPAEITIVFRILRKGPNFSLPFFSKLILFDTYTKIKAMGFQFRLDWVEYI